MPRTALTVPLEEAVRRLARFRAARDGVLSLYVDLQPAGGERRNLRAAVQSALDAVDQSRLTERYGPSLARERRRVLARLRRMFKPRGRSLILFSCEPRGLWELFELQVEVRPVARFGERPFVSQLAAVVDEHERYGVVLLDKEQARILSVFLDEVENTTSVRSSYPGRTAMGGWAQARYERHREAHLHRHVLAVVDAIRAEARRRGFSRLIVGGPDEASSALLSTLPRGLRSRVAGTFTCELFASDSEVLGRVRTVALAAEREGEAAIVRDMIDAATRGGTAILGWSATLDALAQGRVHKLVLVDGIRRRGYVCPDGHVADVAQMGACPACGARTKTAPDLAEWAVEQAFDTDAAVEFVKGEGARHLRRKGGIGAIVRY